MFSLFDTEIFVIAVHNTEKFSSHRDRCRIRKHAVLFTLGGRVEGFTFISWYSARARLLKRRNCCRS